MRKNRTEKILHGKRLKIFPYMQSQMQDTCGKEKEKFLTKRLKNLAISSERLPSLLLYISSRKQRLKE